MVVSVLLDNPVWVGLLVALVVLILFGYLLMRRTVEGLREGYRDGQRRE
jgi:uncharacterized membrane-anchored protein YhcB (DUF1043 family)